MSAGATPTISVLLADDDPAVLAALADLLGDDPDVRVVAMVGDAYAAIEASSRERPNVAVLDVSMPGGGVHAAGEIRRRCPATAIIALSSASDAATRRSMLAAGAGRYLVKGDPGADLLDAIAQANAER